MTLRREYVHKGLGRLLVMPSGGPAAGKRDHGRFMLGPVVEGSGIEIRAVRPDERMRFTVERDGIELVEIAQRAVELAFEDGPEVNRADEAVIELDPESVRPLDLECLHAMDRMFHLDHLAKGLDLAWRPTCLEPVPGREQLRLVDLSPRFHEAALLLTEATANELDRINREDADIILIVRMEVSSMVRLRRLGEHTDNDPEESGDLWHPGLGPPKAVALKLAAPNAPSHSENSTLPAFCRSTSAFGYAERRTTWSIQVNA